MSKKKKKSKFTKYVHEFVTDLNRNSKIHFANIKNNQKTSLKYLFSIIFFYKISFWRISKSKKITKNVHEFVVNLITNCKIHLQMSQIGKRRLGNIHIFFIFSTKLAFDDFQKTQN